MKPVLESTLVFDYSLVEKVVLGLPGKRYSNRTVVGLRLDRWH